MLSGILVDVRAKWVSSVSNGIVGYKDKVGVSCVVGGCRG